MKYVIGADFGTLSVRVLLVDAASGREVAMAESAYPHGVMSDTLPDGTMLPPFFALQDPMDYLQCLSETIRELISTSGIHPSDIVSLGLDCTADSCLPTDEKGVPLSCRKEFISCPHAWMKLWKHHGAEKEAEMIRTKAAEQEPKMLEAYGGQVSAEWMLPKLLETCIEAPWVIEAADRFFQVGDWITYRLTGSETRSFSYAGYKQFYTDDGYPSDQFLESLHPLLKKFRYLLRGKLMIPGSCAGKLHAEGAELLGLMEGTSVAVAGIDAFHPMPALGLTDSGDMLISIGTSACHTIVSNHYHPFPGICGVFMDGMIPGLYGYESGQSCIGDLFAWMVNHFVSGADEKAASERGISVHQLLTERASFLRPGQSGLVALDWWNGCRSPYMNMNLSGCILGMTLSTKTEEIYRALIEATAFGTRVILDNYRENGIQVHRIFACGGITKKNPLLMQIYADVLNMEIYVADSGQTAALGSAVFAAAAAGLYSSVNEASQNMKCRASTCWKPHPENVSAYSRLYAIYRYLSNQFGNEARHIMADLHAFGNEDG